MRNSTVDVVIYPHAFSLELVTTVVLLPERFRLLANFVANNILPECLTTLPFILELVSRNSTHSVFKIFTDEFSNYNVPRADIHNLFKISFGSHIFQPVIKFLPMRKSPVFPAFFTHLYRWCDAFCYHFLWMPSRMDIHGNTASFRP